MKPVIPLMAMLALAVCACNQTTGTMPTTVAATQDAQRGANDAPASKDAATPLVGRWTGDADVIVQWVRQKRLPVTLEVAADASVAGTVGDAKLVDGKFVSRWPNAGYRVHGRLQGNLIDAENVQRDDVDILFDRTDEGTLSGGVHSSGWEVGGKDRMKLSASNMVLRRATTQPAGPR